jgi:hypothetical protein
MGDIRIHGELGVFGGVGMLEKTEFCPESHSKLGIGWIGEMSSKISGYGTQARPLKERIWP